ncbi:ARM repeat-containing protein [Stipitochalara longipes BDJ]|nr:ARM repeat-containing protein [Stipitochalara longipes BDJ]
MSNVDDGQLPTSLEEVEALILQLYSPGRPDQVVKTQETLQKLQRSPEGWQLASSLMNNKDQQIRFFAALTFIVKLNTDAKSLGEEDAQALLQTLIGWLIRCMEISEGPLVVRKLCSTLVAYFMQFSSSWERCVRHLMYCLCTNEACPYSSLDDAPETAVLIQNLSDAKAVAVFWVAGTLVEEVGKTDSNSMKQHKFHRQVVPNVDDIVPLISKYIGNNPTESAYGKVKEEAMKCFQAWVSYSHRAYIDDEIVLEPLRSLIKPALMCLLDDDLYETTVELFSDVLANYSKFLHKEDFDILRSLFNSPWAQERYERLVKGDFDFDSLQFGMFMIAFGDATVQDLTKNLETDPQCQQYLSGLCGLLGAEGHAIHEDKIYVPALEFWSTLVELMVDDIYSEKGEHPSWFPAAQALVMQAIERCWRKSQFPPADEFNSWDSVDRTGFKDARRDFSDLLQQFVLTTGIPLLQVFIDLIHKSAASKNWAELEASMYCLGGVSDTATEDPLRDDYLDKVFTPTLLDLFTDPQTDIPRQTMQSFLDLIISYSEYFKHRTQALPKVLTFVFQATTSPNLAKKASKALTRLCSDCRKILLPELGAFLQQYSNIASNYSLDGSVKEAVMEGIASIIQALENEEERVAPLEQLLNFVEADVEQCLTLLSSVLPQEGDQYASDSSQIDGGRGAIALELGVTASKCLAGIAKGIQVPDDGPVDLETKDNGPSTFWTAGDGSHIQQRIYSMICRVYDALGNRGEIVEELCDVWRQGFREMEPGPFVMPPNLAAQFFMKANIQTPRLGRVITTACSLISSQKWRDELPDVLTALLTWVASLLHTLGRPGNDPDLTQTGIEFILRLLPKYSHLLLDHQPSSSLEFIFMFTLEALIGNDPLPKQVAAEFWATFINLPSQPEPIQGSINSAIQHLGPMLSQALIYNIGGHAARSELDKLSEPVKKLVVRQVNAKAWLEAALLDPSFPSDKVSDKDKQFFLQKIVNLRGARGTNQVIREFWLACRGTNFAYVS